MKIIFFHPDLGIGGAERLVVDTALACQSLNHNVHIVTNFYNENHCFEETKSILSVQVVGNWFPRKIFNRFFAFCSYIRMLIAAIYFIFFSYKNDKLSNPDIIFIDQVSAPIPILKLFKKFYTNKPNFKIIFYCHHPDLLLTDRKTFSKKIYRYIIDWIEEKTTGYADVLLVNSDYTGSVFRKSFLSLKEKDIFVSYPVCNYEVLDKDVSSFKDEYNEIVQTNDSENIKDKEFIYLSLNRYERKKNIKLAIEALSLLKVELSKNEFKNKIKLVVAGGYDKKVNENVEYFKELKDCAKKNMVEENVVFLKSPSDHVKNILLNFSDCVLYTPENEHFGIVPIEAMYKKKPVIACNSGGPLETIINNFTGILCDPNPQSFEKAMFKLLNNPSLIKEMGHNGHNLVNTNFSFNSFQTRIDNLLQGKIMKKYI